MVGLVAGGPQVETFVNPTDSLPTTNCAAWSLCGTAINQLVGEAGLTRNSQPNSLT